MYKKEKRKGGIEDWYFAVKKIFLPIVIIERARSGTCVCSLQSNNV